MKPTEKQIYKFMSILKKKLENTLLIGGEDPYYQVIAFIDYGTFLAQVGEENYERVTEQIANKVALYNLAMDDRLNDSWDEKKILDSLKKAYAFKATIAPKNALEMTNKNRKFYALVTLMDEYIEDLKNIKYIGDTENFTRGQFNFIPAGHFGKSAKKTKTPLKELIEDIIQKYKITNYSADCKKLIDNLNEPPSS